MIRKFWGEEWKVIVFDEHISEKEKFKISNYGRIINCKGKKEFIITKSYINGYQNLPIRQKVNGKQTSRYVHKLVAQHFLEQGDGEYVIHLNYDKKDNHVKNLQWANMEEKEQHRLNNPDFKKRFKGKPTYAKLCEAKVKLIKRKIHDPNRRTRMKMIAKQFGISEMQLYRIKRGENWGHVTDY